MTIDLETADADRLTDALSRLGWLESGETVIAVAPAGEGNMNVVRRITLQGRSLILKQSVPYVARYPDIPAPENRIEVEAAFFEAVQADPALAIRVPRVLGWSPGHRLLGLEDLGTGGDCTAWYQPAGMSAGANGRATRGHPGIGALTVWLWKLHQLEVPADAFANHPMRQLNHTHMFEIPFAPDNGLALPAPLARFAADVAADATAMAAIHELGQVYLGHARHESRPALLHGDFYPGSWLRHPRLGTVVLDPEFAFVGPPEFDVGVFLAHLTLCGLDQTAMGGVLRGYVAPTGFSYPLAMAFGGVEIMRRLLGVARLPLAADDDHRMAWLQLARGFVARP